LWESKDGWGAVPSNYKRKDLVLTAPVAATAGTTYELQLTAWFAGSDLKSSATVKLLAVGSPLVARLGGLTGDVMDDRQLVLDASGSVDPDDPGATTPLAFSWSCMRADFPMPCFSGGARGQQSGATWSLPASLLGLDVAHIFTVTVSKGEGETLRSASASLSMTPRTSSVPLPTGRLLRLCGGDCPEQHSVDEPLSLQLLLDAGAETAAIEWSSTAVYLGGADNKTALTIPASELPKGGSLVVSVRLSDVVHDKAVSSLTSLVVPLNAPPACSLGSGATDCITIAPLGDNTFPDAAFAMTASGFVDQGPIT
jgi:hypothetical protein